MRYLKNCDQKHNYYERKVLIKIKSNKKNNCQKTYELVTVSNSTTNQYVCLFSVSELSLFYLFLFFLRGYLVRTCLVRGAY